MPGRRTVVDPRFPARLRELRKARGMSLRDLAGLTYFGKSTISELENGKKTPSQDTAISLDNALNAGGELIALVADTDPITADDEDRLRYMARQPRCLDAATTGTLAALLDGQRRLEDTVGSAAMIPAAMPQLTIVENLVIEAREWYGRALEWATEAGNVDMVATALNMRGHLAWLVGQVAPMIGLSQAAARQPASTGVRALAVQQEARGLALAGDGDASDRRLDEAAEFVARTTASPDDRPPWVYFFNPDYLVLQRGLAYRYLGRYARAVDLLTGGLEAMPAEVRQTEWVGSYVLQLAATHADAGDNAAAQLVLAEVEQIAQVMGSTRLLAELVRLRLRLSGRGPDATRSCRRCVDRGCVCPADVVAR